MKHLVFAACAAPALFAAALLTFQPVEGQARVGAVLSGISTDGTKSA
jgi:hypothetical protein